MATWYDAMAKHEQELHSLGDQLQALQTANEALQKEVADAASRAEAARVLSVNSTLELERLVKVANAERDKAQKEAESLTLCSVHRAKKLEESWDAATSKPPPSASSQGRRARSFSTSSRRW